MVKNTKNQCESAPKLLLWCSTKTVNLVLSFLGAEVNAKDNYGWTALHVSVSYLVHSNVVVRSLIEYGKQVHWELVQENCILECCSQYDPHMLYIILWLGLCMPWGVSPPPPPTHPPTHNDWSNTTFYMLSGADVEAKTVQCVSNIPAGSTALQIAQKKHDDFSFTQPLFLSIMQVQAFQCNISPIPGVNLAWTMRVTLIEVPVNRNIHLQGLSANLWDQIAAYPWRINLELENTSSID